MPRFVSIDETFEREKCTIFSIFSYILRFLKNSFLKLQYNLIMRGGQGRFLEIKIWTKNITQKFEGKVGNHRTLIFFTNVWKIREFELKSINKKLRFYDGLKIRLFSESVGFWEFVQSTNVTQEKVTFI